MRVGKAVECGQPACRILLFDPHPRLDRVADHDTRMASSLVHEDARILDDRTKLAAKLLDVPGGPVQAIVQLPIVQQRAQRSFAPVDAAT